MDIKTFLLGVFIGIAGCYAVVFNDRMSEKLQIGAMQAQFQILKEWCPVAAQATAKAGQPAEAQQGVRVGRPQ